MSELIARCGKTGRAFNTGFEVSLDDLRLLRPQSGAQMFCRICNLVHEFEFAEAGVCTCGYNCRREQTDCQLERLNR
jgi:hypothetical protein